MVETKPFWKSKLFWLGLLQVAIGVSVGIEGVLVSGLPLTVSGILTILLRAVTKSEITFQ